MKTVQVTMDVYEFHELGEAAQNRVRSEYMENLDLYTLDFVVQNFCIDAEDTGFEIDPTSVYWSDFYVSGAGAGFFGKMVDLARWAQGTQIVLPPCHEDIAVTIGCDAKYPHHSTMTASWAYEGDGELTLEEGQIVQAVVGEVLEDAKAMARQLFHNLMSEYEYICSDEYIADFYNDGSTYFEADGSMFVLDDNTVVLADVGDTEP